MWIDICIPAVMGRIVWRTRVGMETNFCSNAAVCRGSVYISARMQDMETDRTLITRFGIELSN